MKVIGGYQFNFSSSKTRKIESKMIAVTTDSWNFTGKIKKVFPGLKCFLKMSMPNYNNKICFSNNQLKWKFLKNF